MSDQPTAREVIAEALGWGLSEEKRWAIAGNVEGALTDHGYTIWEKQ